MRIGASAPPRSATRRSRSPSHCISPSIGRRSGLRSASGAMAASTARAASKSRACTAASQDGTFASSAAWVACALSPTSSGRLFERAVGQRGGLRMVAARERILERTLRRAVQDQRHAAGQHGEHERAGAPGTALVAAVIEAQPQDPQARQLGPQQQDAPARAAPRGGWNRCRRRSRRLHVGVGQRPVVGAEDLEKGRRRRDEGGLVARHRRCRGGGNARGMPAEADAVGEVIAAEGQQHAVFQRHGALLQAQAIDEGAVGAAQVFDPGAAVAAEDVRVAPRQVAELLRLLLAAARERSVALADEERKARDDDRRERRVLGRRRQRQRADLCAAARRARARRDPDAKRQHAAEADLVAVAQAAGRGPDGLAIERGAVAAALVGQKDAALLAEQARVAARQHHQDLVVVGRERRLAATDRERAAVDADLAQLRPRQRRENDLEVVFRALAAWRRSSRSSARQRLASATLTGAQPPPSAL